MHEHGASIGVSIGPLGLRVLLLAGVIAVAGFALLRPFLGEQGRSSVLAVTAVAAGTGVLGLLLTTGFALPSQLAVLVLAALVAPPLIVRAIDPRFAALRRWLRLAAQWVLPLALAAALALGARVWLGGNPANPVAVLYTGLVIGVAGLSWFALCRPRTRRGRVLVGGQAWLLANAVIAVTAQVTVLTMPSAA